MKRFDNKLVLVTCGSRNTGLDLVERFVREGAKDWTCGSTAASTAKGAAAHPCRDHWLRHDAGTLTGIRTPTSVPHYHA